MINLKFDAEYASEVLKEIPYGYIDKTICGCGLTTVALENNYNTIIAVPSVELIRNKVSQYPNERCNNIILGVYSGITIEDINEYVKNNNILKIMVTYDSIWKVEHLLDKCRLIIDESNKLLSSSALKVSSKSNSKSVDVVSRVFSIAEKYRNTVSFVSATPTPLEYLPEWVSTISQVKIEWTNTIKAKPILMERTYPYKSISQEVLIPLKNKGFIEIGGAVISKVIVFLNSVENIIRVIKESQLNKDDVAIIASNSIENDVKIKGYDRLTNPKKLPKFTFVTSTGFEGIDLEDKEAISIVVSNTSKSYQMIDMLTDLKQAISRQRDKSNPNYNKFIYIYNQSIFSKTKEELITDIDERYKSIEEAIYLWEIAKKDNKRSGFKYTEKNVDFISYTNYIEDTETYILNENMFKADKYFILNVKEQYREGFDLKGSYENCNIIEAPEFIESVGYKELVQIFKSSGSLKGYEYKEEYCNLILDCMKLYNKVWEDYTYAKQMVKDYTNEYGRLIVAIRSKFKSGDVYKAKYVKQILSEIYKEYNISRKAKSTDLQEFMTIKVKKVNGYEYLEIINKYKMVK